MTTQELLDHKLDYQLTDAKRMMTHAVTAHRFASLIRTLVREKATVTFSSFCYPDVTVIDATMEDVHKIVKSLHMTLFKGFSKNNGRFQYMNKRNDYSNDLQITMHVKAENIPYCKVTVKEESKIVKVYEVECKPQSP